MLLHEIMTLSMTLKRSGTQFCPGLEPTALFSGNPPSWAPSLSKANLKNYPPFLWQPSKLVHGNCMKHFKMRELHTILSQLGISSLLFILSGWTPYLLLTLWLDIALNVFHVWYARGMNMKHFTLKHFQTKTCKVI